MKPKTVFITILVAQICIQTIKGHILRHKRQDENNTALFNDLLDSFGGLPQNTINEELPSSTLSSSTTPSTLTSNSSSTLSSISSSTSPSTTSSSPSTTTEGIRTGFYYLLDWNTFLEVDNQLGTRVNLRIQPKYGNPKHFFDIRVP